MFSKRYSKVTNLLPSPDSKVHSTSQRVKKIVGTKWDNYFSQLKCVTIEDCILIRIRRRMERKILSTPFSKESIIFSVNVNWVSGRRILFSYITIAQVFDPMRAEKRSKCNAHYANRQFRFYLMSLLVLLSEWILNGWNWMFSVSKRC